MKYKLHWRQVSLSLILLAGIAARLYEVSYNFDCDETFSVKLCNQPLRQVIWESLQDNPHPPMYNLSLWLWIKIFGAGELAVRSLSVLFSGLLLLVAHQLFRRYLPVWPALGLLLVLALCPFFVYYGQQARPYALAALLAVVNFNLYLAALEAPQERRRWLVWSLSGLLWSYTQYLAVLFVVGELGLAFVYSATGRLKLLGYGALAALPILPWMLVSMGGLLSAGADPLPQIAWMSRPTWMTLKFFYLNVLGLGPTFQLRLFFLIMIVTTAAYAWGIVKTRHEAAKQLLAFLVAFVIPVAVFLLSIFGPKPLFAERQLIGAGVVALLALGLCLATIPRGVTFIFFLAWLAWTSTGLLRAFPHETKPPWLPLNEQISAQYPNMTVVALEWWVEFPLNYYRKGTPVKLYSNLSEAEKAGDFLIVCRPLFCSQLDTAPLRSRKLLASSWPWEGLKTDNLGNRGNYLQLYLIRGASAFRTQASQ